MNRKIIFGTILTSVGILLLLQSFGILIPLGFMKSFWPIGLIIAGIALIFKKRSIAWSIALLTVVLLVLSTTQSCETGEMREINEDIPINQNVENLDIALNYGGGKLNIGMNPNNSINYHIKSTDIYDPTIDRSVSGNDMDIEISRNKKSFARNMHSEWEISIPESTRELDLNFGAAETNIDLTDLSVQELSVESGATDTKIIFDDYPTSATIETGASDFEIIIPEDFPAKISIKGGALSKDIQGFIKKDDYFYTKDFNENSPFISLEIEAGMSTIKIRRR